MGNDRFKTSDRGSIYNLNQNLNTFLDKLANAGFTNMIKNPAFLKINNLITNWTYSPSVGFEESNRSLFITGSNGGEQIYQDITQILDLNKEYTAIIKYRTNNEGIKFKVYGTDPIRTQIYNFQGLNTYNLIEKNLETINFENYLEIKKTVITFKTNSFAEFYENEVRIEIEGSPYPWSLELLGLVLYEGSVEFEVAKDPYLLSSRSVFLNFVTYNQDLLKWTLDHQDGEGFSPILTETMLFDNKNSIYINSKNFKTIGTYLNNTVLGYNSFENSSGSDNIVIGSRASTGVSTVNNSVIIGNLSKTSNSVNNAIILGNGISVSASNSMYLGNSSINNTFINGETYFYKNINVKILKPYNNSFNTTIGNNTFDYNSSTRNGDYNSSFGYGTLQNLTTGNYNYAFGYQSLKSLTTGSNNISIGANSLFNSITASNNISIGNNSLYNNTTGYDNIALGRFSSYLNQTGSENLSLGSLASSAHTNGSRNTIVGHYSFSAGTNGNENTSLGHKTLYQSNSNGNVAIGCYASEKFTGDYNTSLGFYALNSGNGTKNIGIGYFAGNNLSNCSDVICIGSNTAAGTNVSNSIVIGNSLTVNQSNEVLIGSNSTSATRLKGTVYIDKASITNDISVPTINSTNIYASGLIRGISVSGSAVYGTFGIYGPTLTSDSTGTTVTTKLTAPTLTSNSTGTSVTTKLTAPNLTADSTGTSVTTKLTAPNLTADSTGTTVATKLTAPTLTSDSTGTAVTTKLTAPNLTADSTGTTVATKLTAPTLTSNSTGTTITTKLTAPTLTSDSTGTTVATTLTAPNLRADSTGIGVSLSFSAPNLITNSAGISMYAPVVLHNNLYISNGNAQISGNVTANQFFSNSSIRFKENIQKIKNPLNIIENLNGVYFNFKKDGTKHFGLIAEEVKNILPEIVNLDKEGLPESIAYHEIISILIECIKELKNKIDILENKN